MRTSAEAQGYRLLGLDGFTSRLGSIVDVRRQNEKLRAELKPGALRDPEVEIETHLAVLHEHLRDAPQLARSRRCR